MMTPHQYIDRETGLVRTEQFLGDRWLNWAYRALWEDAAWFMKALTSQRMTHVLGFFNYDRPFSKTQETVTRCARTLGVDLSECLDDPTRLNSLRRLFQRRLRYWQVRPMDADPRAIVSPADARLLLGSFADDSSLFLKGKFFDYDELLGCDRANWRDLFRRGDWAIFRLTPDKYHYNHTPVAGRVLDWYEIPGRYHSCNPGPVVVAATPYSKNKRVVTILDTEVPGGSRVGIVAMIEIVALMIGQIEQCYSSVAYDDPNTMHAGMILEKGRPKSLYRPGSSTDVLLFEPGRVQFCEDLVRNRFRSGVYSRFSQGFGRALVETDVRVRSTIGWRNGV
ncbi:MAG: phosphatidylserine decarboxylase [Nitrospira sp. CR2.1]|nr:phosphatidylserine decarboxylase [Nitrospira sp. CR2.1]